MGVRVQGLGNNFMLPPAASAQTTRGPATGSATYARALLTGERFDGPERSPSIRDADLRATTMNGYTTAHYQYASKRAKLIAEAARSGKPTFIAAVETKVYRTGSAKATNLGIVSSHSYRYQPDSEYMIERLSMLLIVSPLSMGQEI